MPIKSALSIRSEAAAAAVMTLGSGIAAVPLLTFIVIGAIIGATNGKPPSRIYGGKDARYGEFKWMVSLSTRRHNHQCGGAIISPRYIITAAHCLSDIKPSNMVVRSGIVDLDDETAIESKVGQFFIHPGYVKSVAGKTKTWNDIAIVELKEDLLLVGRLRAIALPTSRPKTGRARFSGWGDLREDPVIIPTKLQAADVTVIGTDECWDMGVMPKNPQFFCGYQETGHILDGDSGGPLVSNGTLIGVASAGFGVKGIPDHYTNVYHYLDWINTTTNKTIH